MHRAGVKLDAAHRDLRIGTVQRDPGYRLPTGIPARNDECIAPEGGEVTTVWMDSVGSSGDGIAHSDR